MNGTTLFELIHNSYCNGNIQDTIVEVGALLTELYNKPKALAYKIEGELESECISQNVCLLCGSDLEVNSHYEDREYQGQIVKEKIHRTECSNYSCSYVVGE